MARIFKALARLDDHWIGDLIGVISLFAMIPVGLLAVVAFGGAP